tara:strand:+ start:12611 stop:12763 length:153 start_codon:yes stop_codon:yes gene_type:complete
MKEVYELILLEKLKDQPNKKLIQYLQNLKIQILKKIIIDNYKNNEITSRE